MAKQVGSFRTAFCILVFVLSALGTGCASLSRDDDAQVDEIVARVLKDEQRLVEIWPGFWSPGKSFLVFDPSGDALVRTLIEPPPPYRPLESGDGPASPELLNAAVYFHPGVPDGLSESFRIGYGLGEEKLTAIPVDSTLMDSLKLLFHESFHGYQRAHFEAHEGRQQSLFVPPEAFSPESLVIARLEQQVLETALSSESIEGTIAAAAEYLALRGKRLDGLPAQAETIEGMWARSEGMATLAEVRGLSLLFLGNDSGVAELLSINYLTQELSNYSQSPAEAMLRWRQYGVGAAIGWILGRLQVDDWRQRIEQGELLHVILAEAVDYRQQDSTALIAELSARYGFDEQLPAARRRLASMRIRSADEVLGARRKLVIQFSDACGARGGGSFTGEPVRVAEAATLIDAQRYEWDGECIKLAIRKALILEEIGPNDMLRLQIPISRWPADLKPDADGNAVVTDALRIETRRFDLVIRQPARVTRTSSLLMIEFLDVPENAQALDGSR